MANVLKIKRRTSDTTAPVANDLVAGELAINTVNKKLYFKDSSNAVQEIKDNTSAQAEAQADATALAIALG
jgi:hypothetical protein